MDTRHLEKQPPSTPLNIFKGIWDMQLALLEEYQKIEGLPKFPFNLDVKENQLILKDFMARIMEELGEAFQQYVEYGDYGLFLEEMADAIHFFMETLIYSGDIETLESYEKWDITKDSLSWVSMEWEPMGLKIKPSDDHVVKVKKLSTAMWMVTYYLTLARNSLRNKAWKQSEVKTNTREYYIQLAKAWNSLLGVWVCVGEDKDSFFREYWKKNQINWFRIKSFY